ncbi:hypothetical protein [Shimia sp. R9_1]|uniref:hypothetical protein n=1 Tax=Shimia sp. R9_1 TaxID=2821111 RepID=UPI001FFE2432|nr:hypothetical protein [Shimia sp. R9_1]
MFDVIPDMATKRAELSPNALAFHDTTTGRDWTFEQINSAANAVAAGFIAQGLNEGGSSALTARSFLSHCLPVRKLGSSCAHSIGDNRCRNLSKRWMVLASSL